MSVAVYVGRTQAALRHALWLPRDHSDTETGREDRLLSQNLSPLEGGTEFSADKASGGQEHPGPSQRAWEPPFWETGSTGARTYPLCPVRRRADPTTSQKESLGLTQHLNIQLSTDGL